MSVSLYIYACLLMYVSGVSGFVSVCMFEYSVCGSIHVCVCVLVCASMCVFPYVCPCVRLCACVHVYTLNPHVHDVELPVHCV